MRKANRLSMKKIISYILIIVLAVTSLVGCTKYKKWDQTKLSASKYDAVIQDSLVKIDIEESKVYTSSDRVTLVLTSYIQENCVFGQEPHMEVLLKDIWYVVPLSKGSYWNEIGAVLKAKGTTTESFNLDLFYDNLKPGTYRIIKTLYLETGSSIEASVEFDIYAD